MGIWILGLTIAAFFAWRIYAAVEGEPTFIGDDDHGHGISFGYEDDSDDIIFHPSFSSLSCNIHYQPDDDTMMSDDDTFCDSFDDWSSMDLFDD